MSLSELPPITKPLARVYDRFVRKLVLSRNIESAAGMVIEYGGRVLTAEECKEIWQNPIIQDAYHERVEQEELVNLDQMQRRNMLSPDFIKAHAVENVIESEPGSDKTKALEFAAVIVGMITGRGELAQKPEDESVPRGPLIYGELRRTTVQRITETVTQEQALPNLIEAEEPEPAFEIRKYKAPA